MTHAAIIRGKLAIVTDGGSIQLLGIDGFRSGLAQIEASKLDLKPSTKAMADVYRSGIAIWESGK